MDDRPDPRQQAANRLAAALNAVGNATTALVSALESLENHECPGITVNIEVAINTFLTKTGYKIVKVEG